MNLKVKYIIHEKTVTHTDCFKNKVSVTFLTTEIFEQSLFDVQTEVASPAGIFRGARISSPRAPLKMPAGEAKS